MPKHLFCLTILLLCSPLFAQKTLIGEVAQHSAKLTNLTALNSTPFHLKATFMFGNASAPQAVMEEYWISPIKWRRTITFPRFSQTTIVNGATHYEKNEGIYFPTALRVLSKAILQPIPDELQQALNQSKVKLIFYRGLPHSEKLQYCDANHLKTGTPPAVNELSMSVCFSGDSATSTVSSITMPGSDVEFKDRQPFGKLLIARLLTSDSSVRKWEARVIELSALTEVEEPLFAAPENTPEAQRFRLSQVSEQDAREHFKNLPAIDWPAVHSGKTSGVVTIYISTDKEGYVAEEWPISSDNEEIAAAACEQIKQWKLGTLNPKGFLQLETYFTFSFQTTLAKDQPANSPPLANSSHP